MNNTDFNELKAGEVLHGGTYRIERMIDADDFGITYMARNTRLNLVYAVKEFFINGYCTRNAGEKTVTFSGMDATIYEKCREKFIKEAQALSRLNHHNIVKVTDVFAENSTAYMATSCVEGETLQKIIEQRGKLSYDTAVNCIAQLSEAVSYIHSKNMRHCNISPDNVIITSDNRAVLTGFGIAREFARDMMQSSISILTQGYAPLEQYTANSRRGTWSDVYSLGAVAYFALTGQKPTEATVRTLEAMPEPKTLVPSIPDSVNRAILKAMQLKPENRWTVQEFLKSLQNPENKLQSSLNSVKDFADEKLKMKQYLSKLKIDRKYFKIAIPAIIIICAGIFFLMKPSATTYLAAVKFNGKWGFIDKTGKEVIPCKYDYAAHFSEGFAAVELNGKYGYIDKTGKKVIPCKYDAADHFSEGLAAVELNGKWGHINKTGKEVIPCKYYLAHSFFDGLSLIGLNGKYGCIDKTGEEVISCKYDFVWISLEGLVAVKLNGKWGFIDKTGGEVIPYKYNKARGFFEGFAAVELNGKWGYIDKTGKEVIHFKYNVTYRFSEGFTSVELNDKWGYIDKTGKEVIPCKYNDTRYFFEGVAAVKLNDKWGFIDKTGKEVIPCKYDETGAFSGGIVQVKLNGKWGYIDRSGKEVIPFKYDYASDFHGIEKE
jgi:serine/threonine protein kinase